MVAADAAASTVRALIAAANTSSPAALTRTTTATATPTASAATPLATAATSTVAVSATARSPNPTLGYRLTITPQPARARGAPLAFVTADSWNGMRFPNSGRAVLVFRNTSGTPVTVTAWYSPAIDRAGHSIGRQIVIPAGTSSYTTAVFPPALFNQDSGFVDLDAATSTGISLAVIEGYRRW